MSATPLNEELVEAIALRVAELLDAGRPRRMLKVDEVADLLRVTPEWVYEHADELGVIRLGDGERGRLRFDEETVRSAYASRGKSKPVRRKSRPRRGSVRSDVPLLRVGPKR